MNKLLVSLISVTLFLLVLTLSQISVSAQDSTLSATLSAKLKSGGSYELFWPLTAGKTADDFFYRPKIWKEEIQDLFIFNEEKKADYEVILATKRILEAEKLIQKNDENLAVKTLEKAIIKLSSAKERFAKFSQSGNNNPLIKINLVNQLSNIEIFLPQLSAQASGDVKIKSDMLNQIAVQFLKELR